MDSRKELALEYLSRRPAAAAHVLERQALEQSTALLEELPARIVAPVIAAMLPHYASGCLARLPVDAAAGVVQHLSAHRGASLLRGLGQQHQDGILSQLSQMRASSIKFLLSHSGTIVGGWVNRHAFTLPADINVAEARERLRQWEPFDGHRLFVLDRDHELQGAVPVIRLVQADDDQKLAALIGPARTLSVRTSLSAAEQHKDWHDHIEMPVVGRGMEFVGIITYRVLNYALEVSRNYQTGVQDQSQESVNNMADVFWSSIHSTWQTWIDLLSVPAEPQGVIREQPTGRNRNT